MKSFLRLLKFFKPYKIRLIAAFLFSGMVAGLTGAYAWLVRPVLDGIFINKDTFLLNVLPIAILVVAVLKAAFSYGQNNLMNYVGNQVVTDIRSFEIDASSGQSRAIVDEQARTFFNYYGHLYRYHVSDGKEIIYLGFDRKLYSVPYKSGSTFEAGQPTVLFTTRRPQTGLTDERNNYLISPDGQRFLLNNLVEEAVSSPLIVTMNWEADMKR